MYRATTDKRIDGVFTTLNIIDPNTSVISSGDIIGKGDAVIEGDLTVNGILTAGMTIGTIPSSSVIHIPTAPLTGTNVQVALDEVAGLIHTQNTDTILAEGTPIEVGADVLHPHVNQYLELLDTVGGTIVPFTDIDVSFNTQVFVTSDYSHTSGDSSITINQSGTYKIQYQGASIITNGTHRVSVQFQLELNNGGGFASIPGSLSYTNNRTTGSGPMSTNNTSFVTISVGDVVRLVCRKLPVHTSTSVVELTPSATSLRITRLN